MSEKNLFAMNSNRNNRMVFEELSLIGSSVPIKSQLTTVTLQIQEEFDDTKRVIQICKSKKNRQHTGQKKIIQLDTQRSTTHHTENQRTNTNPTKYRR